MISDFVDEVENYAIFRMDPDGCVATWNSGAEQIKGYSRAEILGTHYRTFFTEEAVDQRTPERLLARAESGGSVTGRGWRVHRDGTRFWVDFTLTAVHADDGTLRGFTKVLQDLTAEREYQQQLERQNANLEGFARQVSHDLKNPLSIAQGRLELARETCDTDDLDRAAEAIDRSLELVEELLSRTKEGATDAVEEIDLAETVKWCWRSVETADETLIVETDRAVLAGPSRLKQLVDNLLSNAVEHGGEGVTVTVGDLEDGFYISDNGSGISEGERERVFERGYSSDGGTGIGLRIVRESVDAHGWTIDVTESEAGGARFEIHGVEAAGER